MHRRLTIAAAAPDKKTTAPRHRWDKKMAESEFQKN
jgi:hypothetical protein